MKKILLFLFFSLALSSIIFGQSGWKTKLAPKVLTEYVEDNELDLIVVFKDKADVSVAKYLSTKSAKGRYVYEALKATTQSSQKNVMAWAAYHHYKTKSFYITNALQIKIPAASLEQLASFVEVKYISNNGLLRYHEPVEKYPALLRGNEGKEWGIDTINANDVWALGYTGQGVVVGGEDTGYDWKHPAIQPKYRGWDGTTADHNYNWHDAIHELNPLNGDSTSNPLNNPCGLDSPEPCDDGSHGTHTMGTMVGSTPGDTIGVEPDARWIGVRNMERGWGKPSTYIEGFEWFLAPTDLNNQNPDPDKSPDVINNSWGCPPNEGCDLSNFGVMQDVVANLKAAGIVVVVSAGNAGSGCGSIDDPAAIFEESFSIGATRSNDTIANFSSRGGVSIDGSFRTKPNVSAPGVGVRSCTPGGNYQFFSGTSMAGPHVAGAVALILSAAPELKGQVDVIEDILEQTAIPKYTDQACDSIPGSIVPNNTYGYGRIDVLQAVKLALKTVAANDIEKPKTTVTSFPNPVSNTLYFDVKEFNGDILIEIFDVPGKLIYSSKQQVAGDKLVKCDFQHESTGLYFYKITGQQLCVAGKFVKN